MFSLKGLLSLFLSGAICIGSMSASFGADNQNKTVTISGYIGPDYKYSKEIKPDMLLGYCVYFEGTELQTSTNMDGYFRITAPLNRLSGGMTITRENCLRRTIKLDVKDSTELGTPEYPVEIWSGDVYHDGMQDGVINMGDIVDVSKSFGTKYGDEGYNGNRDVNGDFAVNMSDIMQVAKHFNKSPEDYTPLPPTPQVTPTPKPTPSFPPVRYKASENPPAGQPPEKVPQFVSIGFYDNFYSGLEGSGGTGGMKWILDFLDKKTNPAGTGNPSYYDGTPVRMTFFTPGFNGDNYVNENDVYVNRIWGMAYRIGHEVANQTYFNAHGGSFNQKQWEYDINKCNDFFVRPFDPNEPLYSSADTGLGCQPKDIKGFAAPYLEYNEAMFKAAANSGLYYDFSIEEGWQENQNGTNYNWPYTLQNGSPGEESLAAIQGREAVNISENLWEVGLRPFIAPPDDKCPLYGVPAGLREKLKSRSSSFNVSNGKITGHDYNLWAALRLSKDEYLAILKYSLDLRLNGNKCPFIMGSNTGFYSSKWEETYTTSFSERQKSLEDFINYSLLKSDVRIVPIAKILHYMEYPVLLNK